MSKLVSVLKLKLEGEVAGFELCSEFTKLRKPRVEEHATFKSFMTHFTKKWKIRYPETQKNLNTNPLKS